jgi:2-(1,2-epoxy-1,2-dihydrophenyl)acetyl-CoA isomerase
MDLNKKYSELKLEHKNHTLWMTLNRPSASNAFSSQMILDFCSVLEHADQDESVRVIVITGEGKHFCAGGDIKDMASKSGMFEGEPNELRERYIRGIQNIPRVMNLMKTPVIAMINGAAIGAGLDVACMCDIRIASEKAKFGETFARLGLIPGDGGTYFLQRIVGFAKAMEMTLTADIYSAKEAMEIGLVNAVVSEEELVDKTREYVDKILMNAPIAISMAKRAITHAYKNDLYSQLDLLASYQGITQRTQDHFHGLKNLKSPSTQGFEHK